MPARRLSLATALSLLPVAAFAHTGLGDTSGFTHGFLHPVTGIDHVLAMVMVGAFAWQRGGAARWCLPVSFVALMVTGAALGMVGVAVPFVTQRRRWRWPWRWSACSRCSTATPTARKSPRRQAASPMAPASWRQRRCCMGPGLRVAHC